MNRLGMIVDISHVADKTFWDALEASKAPPFASHSSCRALSNVPRNMTDEMIVALAKKGGVVQINFSLRFPRRKPRPMPPKAMRPRMLAVGARQCGRPEARTDGPNTRKMRAARPRWPTWWRISIMW